MPKIRRVRRGLVKHLQNVALIGYLPRKKGFKFKETPYQLIIDEVARLITNHEPTQGIVRPTKSNYWNAVEMFDHPFTHPDAKFENVTDRIPKELNQDPIWKLAFDMVISYLMHYIPMERPKYDDLYMDFNTNPGYPENIYWNQKRDVPCQRINDDLYCKYETYYWNLAMKRERLPMDKILSDKMRSFMMPSMVYLMLQKIFSQQFNEHLKKVPWIAYGLNWHRKGWHQLMSRFERFRHKSDWDVKYWDKRFPLKYWCYKIREKFLIMDNAEKDLFWNIAKDEITPNVILPTGEVLQLQAGQCSGSENTTADNCIAHLLIIFYDIIEGYKIAYSSVPNLKTIMQHCTYSIYSDDVCNAHDDKFYFLKDGKRKSEIYAKFGMLIEYTNHEKFQQLDTMEGLRFLGFVNKEYQGTYVPYYPYDKVLDSTVLTMKKEKPTDQLVRFMALLDLLTFTEHYDEYVQFIKYFCAYHNMEIPFIQNQQEKQNYELCKQSFFTVSKFKDKYDKFSLHVPRLEIKTHILLPNEVGDKTIYQPTAYFETQEYYQNVFNLTSLEYQKMKNKMDQIEKIANNFNVNLYVARNMFCNYLREDENSKHIYTYEDFNHTRLISGYENNIVITAEVLDYYFPIRRDPFGRKYSIRSNNTPLIVDGNLERLKYKVDIHIMRMVFRRCTNHERFNLIEFLLKTYDHLPVVQTIHSYANDYTDIATAVILPPINHIIQGWQNFNRGTRHIQPNDLRPVELHFFTIANKRILIACLQFLNQQFNIRDSMTYYDNLDTIFLLKQQSLARAVELRQAPIIIHTMTINRPEVQIFDKLDCFWEGWVAGGRKIDTKYMSNEQKSFSDNSLKTRESVRRALKTYEDYKTSFARRGVQETLDKSVSDFVTQEIENERQKWLQEQPAHNEQSGEDQEINRRDQSTVPEQQQEYSQETERAKIESCCEEDSDCEGSEEGHRHKNFRRCIEPLLRKSGQTDNRRSRRIPTCRSPPRLRINQRVYSQTSTLQRRKRKGRRRGRKTKGRRRRTKVKKLGLLGKQKKNYSTKQKKLQQTRPQSLQQQKELGARRHEQTLRDITRRGGYGVNRNMGYDTPMPIVQPFERSRKDGVTVIGSEFLTSITVYTSQSTSPTPTGVGHILFWMPINPRLLSGTRISQLSSLYQHYKYNYLIVEYVPSVPSIQDGALGMVITYDPIENWTTKTTDSDTLMRIFMAHKGGNIANVYSCMRAALYKNEDTLNDYFTQAGEDFRNEDQGNIVIVAASSFTPYDGAMTAVTLGNVIIHYSCSLHARDVEVGTSSNIKYGQVGANGLNVTQTFGSVAAGDSLIFAATSNLWSNINKRIDGFFIIRVLDDLTVGGANPSFYSTDMLTTFVIRPGMVLFGYFENQAGPFVVTQTEEDAAEKNGEKAVKWLAAQTGSQTVVHNFNIMFVNY